MPNKDKSKVYYWLTAVYLSITTSLCRSSSAFQLYQHRSMHRYITSNNFISFRSYFCSEGAYFRSRPAGKDYKYAFQNHKLIQSALFATKEQRLERILANRGLGSRKEVKSFIIKGKVTTMDGKVLKVASEKYPNNIDLLVNGQHSKQLPLIALFNKPLGVHSTMGDPMNRPNLMNLLSSFPFLQDMHPVGRLDADTSGLLLFSSNGQLTQFLLSPASNIPREYEAIVTGAVEFNSLRLRLKEGVVTSDGKYEANLIYSHLIQSKEEINRVLDLAKSMEKSDDLSHSLKEEAIGEGFSYLRLSVTEGKYRMVRRLLHNAGHSVILLHRSKYGKIDMASDLNQLNGIDKESKFVWPPLAKVVEGDVQIGSEIETTWAMKLIEDI